MEIRVKNILAPYRARIDALDEQIIDLLRKRYSVIEEVGHLKAGQGIDAVLQDRVDEVRERAAALAKARGLDEDFIRKLYAQLIDHSCQLEDNIIAEINAAKKAAS
jgi:chorismate mutase-like protein